jgi:hypothetical protein
VVQDQPPGTGSLVRAPRLLHGPPGLHPGTGNQPLPKTGGPQSALAVEAFVQSEKMRIEKGNQSWAECSEGEKDKRKGKSLRSESHVNSIRQQSPSTLLPPSPSISRTLGLERTLLPGPSREDVAAHRGQNRKSKCRNLPPLSL